MPQGSRIAWFAIRYAFRNRYMADNHIITAMPPPKSATCVSGSQILQGKRGDLTTIIGEASSKVG
jgi:hypothetical protein